MSPKKGDLFTLPVVVIISIFGVLATILALQGLVGSEWNNVASAVGSCIAIIGVIAFAIAVIVTRK